MKLTAEWKFILQLSAVIAIMLSMTLISRHDNVDIVWGAFFLLFSTAIALGLIMSMFGGVMDFDWEGPEDELYEAAVRAVIEAQNGSVSFLQRKFQIGYNRAAWLIEHMEHDGIVSKCKADGSRDVLRTIPDHEQ